jgi:SH3-like domain-containing protein
VTLPPAITSAAPTITPASTEAPTVTPTPMPSAVVNSEVGLYLRPEPGSDVELELLANGAVLELLEGRQTVDGVEWQQVRSAAGNEGWVAVEFITYQ